MSRALVLGGGGPVGIGWEAGLLVGLGHAGTSLAGVDAVIGTSAGSVVGAQLCLGRDLGDASRQISEGVSRQPFDEEGAPAVDRGVQALMAAMAEVVESGLSPEQGRKRLGKLATSSSTIAEEHFLSIFAQLGSDAWPEHFACTAVDTASGELVVWDRAAAIELCRGVASSCAVPGVYPPVEINGRRYMDGGMRSGLNADLAAGHDSVVVVSVTATELPHGFSDAVLESVLVGVAGELETLRSSGSRVALIGPGEEFLGVSQWGMALMDPSKVAAAFEAGVRQGGEEADKVAALWAG